MNKLFVSILILLSLLSSFNAATCSGGYITDQQNALYTTSLQIPTALLGAGVYSRHINRFGQEFIPAVSGELYSIEAYGSISSSLDYINYNYYSTDALVCNSSRNDSFYFTEDYFEKWAQSFPYTSSEGNMFTIRFRLAKESSSVGDLAVAIEADNGTGYPSGTPLYTGLLYASDVWNNLSDGFNTYSVDFTNLPSLTNGNTYWIVFGQMLPGTDNYYLEGDNNIACHNDPAQYQLMSYNSINDWTLQSDMMIHLEINSYSGSNPDAACLNLFSGSTLLGSQSMQFTSSAGWSTNGLWYTDLYCSTGASTTGPILASGITYNFWVTDLLYGDNEVYYSNANPYASGFMIRDFWGKPISDAYFTRDLTFRTQMCVGSVTPTPTPTASVTPTPPIACTSTMDCPYAYNCDTAMHLCYPRAQKYQQWGLEWIGLFFQMNTVYIIVVGAIILIFLVALPTLSRAREE